jgi:hypothetical protein
MEPGVFVHHVFLFTQLDVDALLAARAYTFLLAFVPPVLVAEVPLSLRMSQKRSQRKLRPWMVWKVLKRLIM